MKLEAAGGAVRLRLRVKPGARKAKIVGPHGDALKLAVQAPPEDGRANEAVIALLAEILGLRKSAIEILSGQTSRDKVVAIAGLSPAEIRARLQDAAESFTAKDAKFAKD